MNFWLRRFSRGSLKKETPFVLYLRMSFTVIDKKERKRMKRGVVLAMACVIVVGCFGRPATTVSAPSAPEREDAKASPVATQETLNSSPIPEKLKAPVATTESPTTAPVVAQDSGMAISDIRVGDPVLEAAVRFTVNKAGTVTVRPQSTDGLRLFKVRDDQFGKTELVGDLAGANEVGVTIPTAGAYLVAGKERPVSFMDEPMALREAPSGQYRTQSQTKCGPTIINRPSPQISMFDWNHVAIAAWTREPRVPTAVDVYIHHGAGGRDRPNRNSFEAIEGFQPDGFTVHYIRDQWNTRLTADVAAQAYNNRWSCGDSERLRLDLCHSAGCLKALIAFLQAYDENLQYGWNNIGIIAASPAFGGSHVQIPDLFKAWAAQAHIPIHLTALYFLAQRDLGFVTPVPDPGLLVLRNILTGSKFTPLNELGRSLAWHGRGPQGMDIPTLSYPWFSTVEAFFGISFPKRLLKPQSRFLTPKSNALGAYAPETYIDVNDGGGEYFNFAEALDGYYTRLRNGVVERGSETYIDKDGTTRTRTQQERGMMHIDKKVDVIVTYLNEADIQKGAEVFENKYGAGKELANLWKLADPSSEYRLAFETDIMPWLGRFVATAPSVTPYEANESRANDCCLTLAEQLGLASGSSIIAIDPVTGELLINDTAIKGRLPAYIDEYARFKGRSHIVAGVTDSAIRAQIERWIVKRRAKLEEEERTTVLTEQDKTFMRNSLFPKDGGGWYLTGSGTTNYKYLDLSTLQFIQDPNQRNLVRVVGSGRVEYYSQQWGPFWQSKDYYSQWVADHRFVRRNGVWLLLTK